MTHTTTPTPSQLGVPTKVTAGPSLSLIVSSAKTNHRTFPSLLLPSHLNNIISILPPPSTQRSSSKYLHRYSLSSASRSLRFKAARLIVLPHPTRRLPAQVMGRRILSRQSWETRDELSRNGHHDVLWDNRSLRSRVCRREVSWHPHARCREWPGFHRHHPRRLRCNQATFSPENPIVLQRI